MMEIVKNIVLGILQGIFDSVKGLGIVFRLDKAINNRDLNSHRYQVSGENVFKEKQLCEYLDKSNVKKRVLQCCVLNGGIFWLSIIFFEYALLPGLKTVLIFTLGESSNSGAIIWGYMQPFLSFIFRMIWVMPICILSKIVSGLWFQDIANSAFKFRKGRPQYISSVSKLVADTLFSVLVQVLFLAQCMFINVLPINSFGSILSFMHICLLYALYSFEYKWFNMGWELHKRLSYIEQNWPYFLGFGMPLAILTNLPTSYIVSGCVFSIAFPIFIISGNEATPITGSCDIALRLFSPVVALSNMFFYKPTVISKKLPDTEISITLKKNAVALKPK